ncbi:18885_t:CDS:1, partial [Gigaspora margarita]
MASQTRSPTLGPDVIVYFYLKELYNWKKEVGNWKKRNSDLEEKSNRKKGKNCCN